MTQTVEDPRLATGGWLDLTRQAFHLLDYSPLSGRTIPISIFVSIALTICMNLLLHTALISKISAMMRILLSIGSGSLTNLPKKKINNIFGGYTPKPL